MRTRRFSCGNQSSDATSTTENRPNLFAERFLHARTENQKLKLMYVHADVPAATLSVANHA